jgi:hypothetical protein
MGNGNFDGTLVVKGAEANSWYLVTLYSDHTPTGNKLGSVGYYGKVAKPSWANIALFQTDADGNAGVHLPYTSPAWDPVHEALIAPTLLTGTYADVKIYAEFINAGASPDWGVLASGNYDCTKSLWEMDTIDFTIAAPSQEVMILVQKSPSGSWPVINYPNTWGELKYRVSGPEFDFDFDGYGLMTDMDYSLIYYADPWPGNHRGALLGTGHTDPINGDLTISGSVDLGMDLPDCDDDNYPSGAKIWLVPSSDYDAGNTKMIGWHPSNYLFEYDLITYDDTDIGPCP